MMDIADGLKMVLEELRAGGMMKYEQYSRLYDEVESLRNEHPDDNKTDAAEPGDDDFVRRGDIFKTIISGNWMEKFISSKCTLGDIVRAVPAADAWPAIRGEWEPVFVEGEPEPRLKCSRCGGIYRYSREMNYCQSCGSKNSGAFGIYARFYLH